MPRRVFHFSLRQCGPLACACQRWIGSTKPEGSVSPRSKTRAMRWRSSGSFSFEFSGVTFSGRLPSLTIHSAGSS